MGIRTLQMHRFSVETCADVIVSAAAPGQFWSAAERRRSKKVGGGDAGRRRPKIFFLKGSRQNFVLSSKFSDDLFSHRSKIGNRKSTHQKCHRWRADKLSAAARRSTKVDGGGANKLSAAARPAPV